MSEATRRVTPRELLELREEKWRDRLARASLAAEVLDGIKVEHRRQALDCLGRVLRGAQSAEMARRLRRWPAVHVVVTTGVATDHYTAGTFWPYLQEALREYSLPDHVGFQASWGRTFLDNLGALGLPTFAESDDAGTRYVGRILMHCGMPTRCLGDYFELVSEQRSRRAGLGPDAFVSWAAARAERGRLDEVPKPVSRFLQHGGEYALDVTGRVFDLLDAVRGGGDGADAGLPERFRAVAAEMRARDLIRSPARRTGSPSDPDDGELPRIVLEAFGFGVVLRLPGIRAAQSRPAEWVVDADGERQRVATRARLVGFQDAAPPSDVPLTRPVRTITVAVSGHDELAVTIPVVDEAQPLLAFDENGEFCTPGLPLPGHPVWLLFPGTPADLRVDGTPKVLTESPVPPGWVGWCLLLVDLEEARSVRVGHDGVRRHVQRHASARVAAPVPLPGVRTSHGVPVLAELPVVSLPADLAGADWDVALLGPHGDVARWRSGADGDDPQTLWDLVPRPLVGSYTVRVRGPWGRGTTRSFDVVEGLDVRYSPGWRRFGAEGLQPCTARLAAGSGVTLTRDALDLDANDRETFTRAGAHGSWLSLVVAPPHMTIAYQTEASGIPPSTRPITLFQEDVVADAGRLLLDVGEADPYLYYLASGHAVQTIAPGAGRDGVYPFDLARLTDTLAAHPRGRLALDPGGALVVAEVRPRKLFSDIRLLGPALELADAVDVDGLTAVVYAVRAPWLRPVAIPIADGQVPLPAHLQDAGPLLVTVRIEDPWVPQEMEEWPDRLPCRLIDAPGYVVSDDPDLTRLSAFLAGDQPLHHHIDDFTALWTVRGRLRHLDLGGRRDEVAAGLDEMLNAHPRRALLAVAESRVSAELIPAMLIRSGLVWANLADAHDDTPPTWTTRNALAATLLSAADADWSADEIEAAALVCGDAVAELLIGKDRNPSVGQLDQGALVYDAKPERREAIVRAASLVPAGILSEDSRVLAAMEYVRKRHDPQLGALVRQAHKCLEACTRVLAYLKDPAADAAVAARRPSDTTGGWRVIPTISLALAFVARHAARGDREAGRWLARYKGVWSLIAETAPSLATTDIILAELLVSSGAANPEGPHQ